MAGRGTRSEDETLVPLIINFEHHFGEETLSLNNIQYSNAAGNTQSIEKLQYVISELTLFHENGSSYTIDDYHFIDINDASTLEMTKDVNVPVGEYSTLSFVFGLSSTLNQDGEHLDLNELSWSWPTMLGGGYHILKLEV